MYTIIYESYAIIFGSDPEYDNYDNTTRVHTMSRVATLIQTKFSKKIEMCLFVVVRYCCVEASAHSYKKKVEMICTNCGNTTPRGNTTRLQQFCQQKFFFLSLTSFFVTRCMREANLSFKIFPLFFPSHFTINSTLSREQHG